MSLDPGILGTTAAELMDSLEDEYEDTEEAKLIEVAVVALVRSNADEDGDRTLLHYRFSEALWTHQLGLIEGCAEALHAGRSWQDTDPEPDEE